jgi:hypothetical protein
MPKPWVLKSIATLFVVVGEGIQMLAWKIFELKFI